MTQVRSEELSALMDGELDAARAAEVRAAIAADPALHADHAALLRLDARLRGAVEAAGFMPDIGLPVDSSIGAPSTRTGWPLAAMAAVLTALLLVRLLPKLIDMAALGVLLQLAAAAAILVAIWRMAREQDAPAAASL